MLLVRNTVLCSISVFASSHYEGGSGEGEVGTTVSYTDRDHVSFPFKSLDDTLVQPYVGLRSEEREYLWTALMNIMTTIERTSQVI